MSTNNHTPDDLRELDEMQRALDEAKKASHERSKKVENLTSRFQELRRKNHFRLMLEELFDN